MLPEIITDIEDNSDNDDADKNHRDNEHYVGITDDKETIMQSIIKY